MNILNKILQGFLGDKNAKDVKELQKYVDLANEAGQKLSSLTIDELRGKTLGFKEKLAEATKDFKSQIDDLKKQVEETEDFGAKEDLYTQIDKINKDAYEVEEKILLEILPEAFAVMRETGKRFTENETLEVTASDFDKVLVSRGHDFVSLKDDHSAIWKTSWDAAGRQVTWDMSHYNVQFIGGSALHLGRIAEMQTGEGKTLVATLPIYLNALTGRGVHLVTVNDYLAKRDMAWMRPIFS